MLENLGNKFGQAREAFTAMSSVRKVLTLGLSAAVLASFVMLLVWTNKTDFEVIYSGLSQEDAGAIVAKLKERKIPYQLTADGTVVMVPGEVVPETRLFLATEGLPTGGGVGMELFNKTSLGATDFVQRLNYQRALQGELERTISTFPEVESARVHLSIPKESLFIEEAREPSASVVLKLKSGQTLGKAQMAGIVHLVASSIEGLSHRNISIVDTSGGLLYSQAQEEDGSLLTATQIEQQHTLEQNMAKQVTSMLERLVGPGMAMTRVRADLNFQQVDTSEEIYDPDRAAIRSEQRLKEVTQGPSQAASGTPNARYELGAGGTTGNEGEAKGEHYEKTDDTTNYEITKINRRILQPAGEVKRLSVAVVIDETYAGNTDNLAELVRSAVGFDETRGDTVTVTKAKFFTPEEEVAPMWTVGLDYARQFGRPAFNVLLIVLFFLFVVRPVMGWLRQEATPPPPSLEAQEALPDRDEEARLDAPPEKGKLTREQVLALAQQNPDKTINLIRAWIEER